MAANNFYRYNNNDLAVKATTVHSSIALNQAVLGLTAAQVTGLMNAASELVNTNEIVADLKQQMTGALAAQEEARAEVLSRLTNIGNTIYNNSSLTDAQIGTAGYAIRDTGRTPVVPNQPLNLVAVPSNSGTVRLSWKRNGNPYGVMFMIETRPSPTAAWRAIGTTTKSKIVLSGFPGGIEAWFRVTAMKDDVSATPSLPVSIWTPSSEVQLELAA